MFRQPRVFGIVLDLSPAQTATGKRVAEEVRKSLIAFVRTFDDYDGLYLYHPDLIDVSYRLGEQVGALGNYESDGYKTDLTFALKQTLYVTASSDDDNHRVVMLVTDRPAPAAALKKIVTLNKKEGFDCEIVLLTLAPTDPIDGVEILGVGDVSEIVPALTNRYPEADV